MSDDKEDMGALPLPIDAVSRCSGRAVDRPDRPFVVERALRSSFAASPLHRRASAGAWRARSARLAATSWKYLSASFVASRLSAMDSSIAEVTTRSAICSRLAAIAAPASANASPSVDD